MYSFRFIRSCISWTQYSWVYCLYVRIYMYLYLGYLGPSVYEPRHDKTNKMAVRPAKTQISEAPPPPRSQRHLEISNKMESFPSYGSRIFVFTIFEAILFFSTSLEPYAICEQQRRRSACASAQSDQHLYCSLPRQYDIFSIYIGNFMTLASFFSWADRFESYLVENPEDRFSRDEAHMGKILLFNLPS